jgi:hypothetical protein
MSVNTAILVNAILDLSALGVLAYVCLRPFRAAATRAETAQTPARSRRAGVWVAEYRR